MNWVLRTTLYVLLLSALQSSFASMPQYQPGSAYWPVPPGYPGYAAPGRQQQQQVQMRPVRFEARLDTTEAFVYQNLVLTLDVISGENLAALKFTLPRSDAFVLKSLGSLTAVARGSGSQREIVTSQQYMVIPLRDGVHSFELSAEGSTPSLGAFDLGLQSPMQLTIKPSRPEVQPWLPLDDLQLTAQLSNEENLKMGKPATLVLEISATGTTGAQLPSLEKQLQAADLRIYREKTENEGKLTAEGRLFGRRVEHYTLLPGKDVRLSLPAIEIQWWNITRSRSERTLLPQKNLGVNQAASDDRSGGFNPFSGDDAWVFWQPLILIAFVTGLYWSWIWARSRAFGVRIARHLSVVTEPLRKRFDYWLTKLSPRRFLHRTRRAFANSLPRSWRIWYCVRVADNETDPEVWLQVLRFLMERRLGINAKTSTHQLATQITQAHPGADEEKMLKMLLQLDEAIYGNKPIIDFEAWKKAFKREIRPRIFPSAAIKLQGMRKTGLPGLNP